jgi:hypothetical protein
MLDLFDPVIDEITKLVEQQVEEANKNSASAIDVTLSIYLYGTVQAC